MLYMQGGGRIGRVHGPFVSDREVEDVVAFLRAQGEPNYVEEVTEAQEEDGTAGAAQPWARATSGENLFDQAVAIVAREGKCSTSFIQRHLSIGYNKAAKLVEQMETRRHHHARPTTWESARSWCGAPTTTDSRSSPAPA